MNTSYQPMDIASRLDALRRAMAQSDLDAVLVTSLTNIRYLTGFTGSAGMLAVTPDGATFTSDGRYDEQAHEQLSAAGVDAEIIISNTEQRVGLLARCGDAQRVGLEAAHISWASADQYRESWFPKSEVVPTKELVEGLRIVKDAGEVDRIRAACAIADDAFAELRPQLATGLTEREFAIRLETAMRSMGADGLSFEAIVAAGPNGAKPHARPSTRTIEPGELVVIDFGCIVDGYCSDMTRTVSVGEPSPEARRIFDVVLQSQRDGRERVRAGVAASEVDAACRTVIADAGWGDAFIHGTGHGVGLDIHEEPRVSGSSSDVLVAGNVVTVEPGIYISGLGGVRIEDTVVVTEDGCEILTTSPKDLLVA
ncbi:MAG: aminopeptidase P family protein [Acidimicrobiia bacterium]|nr:aminopeptidase P family protein [Acidimicrobiia bacterium]